MSAERRVVRIPTEKLVEGWRQVIEVEVAWVCPVCRGPRGEVEPAIAYDGRYRMQVDGWKNPCGHIDQYADVEREGRSHEPRRPDSRERTIEIPTEFTDDEGTRLVVLDGRLSLYGHPSMSTEKGTVALGIDLPRNPR